MGSQARQDEFVLSLIDKGTFLDIGCYYPEEFNNSYLLEKRGWTGLAIYIVDYSEQWKSRTTPFICADALEYDYAGLPDYDYPSLDVEGDGNRFAVLKRVIENRKFKVITIEHDRYLPGHTESEAIPQRDLLTSLGYYLLCEDVKADTRPFEDWWITPGLVKDHTKYYSKGLHCSQIMLHYGDAFKGLTK